MARRSHRRARHELNAWPGYVDALSTLLMVVTFVLMVFVLGQQFLTSALNRRTQTLNTLKQEVAALQQTLSLTHVREQELDARVASITAARDALQGDLAAAQAGSAEKDRAIGAHAATIATLQAEVQQLNSQLATISQTLNQAQDSVRARDAQITDLGKKLSIAMASEVNTLKQYRSEFFGQLRAALKSQKGISVVGDRFVFQSAILFPTGSASLTPEGVQGIAVLAKTLHEIAHRIPKKLPWLLRVDGHADKLPIHSGFADNWALSSARAITVVQALIRAGIDPHHLAATGFSDYQPLDPHDTAEAYAKNRRIEFRLTDR